MKKKQKQQYRVRNWGEYNAALVGRGSLTIWLEEASLTGWLESKRSGKQGASLTYSEAAIQAVLTLKGVYGLPLRGAQGFVGSVLGLMGLNLPTPHYSTLSRRQTGLKLEVPRLGGGQALHLVVDSTGCKVYGEGRVPFGRRKCAPMARARDGHGVSCIWAWMKRRARSWRQC